MQQSITTVHSDSYIQFTQDILSATASLHNRVSLHYVCITGHSAVYTTEYFKSYTKLTQQDILQLTQQYFKSYTKLTQQDILQFTQQNTLKATPSLYNKKFYCLHNKLF